MKFSCFLVLGCLFSAAVNAQNVAIPDANFKAALLADKTINTNGDTEIQIKEAAAFNGMMNVSAKSIADLTGISAFTKLTELNCSENQLASLDLSKNTKLGRVFCYDNQLISLNISKNKQLTSLHCNKNKLQALDVSKNTNLTDLLCNDNQIADLNLIKNSKLEVVFAQNNPLTCIKVSNLEQFRTKQIPKEAKLSLDCK